MAAANSEDVCRHHKYGFCKNQETCRLKHVNDICEKKGCEIDKCSQRHPRSCKYFQEFKRCKFGSYCLYRHEDSQILCYTKNHEEKFKALTEKTTELETKVACLSELLNVKTAKTENLELKLNTLEEKVEQDSKDLIQKLNSLSDSLDQISERIKEVEQNNYILMHAVDDVEKASKVIQIQLEAMSEPDFVCHFCDQVFQSELHLQNHTRMEHGRAHRDKT